MVHQRMGKVAVFVNAVLMAAVLWASTVAGNASDMLALTSLVSILLLPLLLAYVPNCCRTPWFPWLLLFLLRGTQSFIFTHAREDEEEVEGKGTLYVIFIILVLMFAIWGCCDANQHHTSDEQAN